MTNIAKEIMKFMNTYVEKSREIPVRGSYDVIVAGGGTAGFAAAIAAARRGSSVLVLERMNCLGGQMTAGIMGIFCAINDQKKIVVKGIPEEFFDELHELGGVNDGLYGYDETKRKCQFIDYDAEAAKSLCNEYVLRERAKGHTLDILYETWISDCIVENNKVIGIIVENKTGRSAYYGKCIVDCTADADIVAWSGADFYQLPVTELHPVTLITKLAGVDKQRVLDWYYNEHPTWVHNSPTQGWSEGIFHKFGIGPELEGYELPPELEYLRSWFMLIYESPRDGEMYLNMTGEFHVDGTKTEEISDAITISRKRIDDCVSVLKKVIPGYESAYILATASLMGIRETRQVKGIYKLTEEDLFAFRRFDDALATMSAPIGHHTADGESAVFQNPSKGHAFDIPLRACVPEKMDGLIVAGRCISASHDAMGATRIMPGSMSIGQGAGVAASLAVELGVEPRDIPSDKLRAALLEQNVYLQPAE